MASSTTPPFPEMEFRLEPALERRDPSSVITAVALDDEGGRIYVGEEEKEVVAPSTSIDAIERKPIAFSFPKKKKKSHRDLRRRSRGVEPPRWRRPRRARGEEARRWEQKGKMRRAKRQERSHRFVQSVLFILKNLHLDLDLF